MISTFMAAAISGIISGGQADVPQQYEAGGVHAQPLDDSSGKHACKGQNACKGQGGCKG